MLTTRKGCKRGSVHYYLNEPYLRGEKGREAEQIESEKDPC